MEPTDLHRVVTILRGLLMGLSIIDKVGRRWVMDGENVLCVQGMDEATWEPSLMRSWMSLDAFVAWAVAIPHEQYEIMAANIVLNELKSR